VSISTPSPANLVGTLPLPLAWFRARRRRQIQRLTADRDRQRVRSPEWHRINSLVVFAEHRLDELERR
jgi:hypothetical protein